MKRMTMVLIIPLATIFILGACARPAESVTFTDTKLEAAIREAINKPEGPIQRSDLESLTTLIAELKRIQNLAGLEYCVYLRELNLCDNQISDISPLASLPRLHKLTISNNPLSPASLDIYIPQLEERGVEVDW